MSVGINLTCQTKTKKKESEFKETYYLISNFFFSHSVLFQLFCPV